MVCCFFGHGTVIHDISGRVEEIINEQLEQGTELFLLGKQGEFDRLVLGILRKMRQQDKRVRYQVVLAYFPGKDSRLFETNETVFPEGQETVPPRYAISRRNRYMVEQSDRVIAYVTHSWGGAASAVAYAERKGKKIIRIP